MTEYRSHPFARLRRPPWTWGRGDDRFGVFAEIHIAGIVQRMRWIPPGTFQMGSPESEEGRREWEGPRHEVTLTEGFWLADTPCTQELWDAVMGENPSRFRSPHRPVEQVSWDDCQRFFARVDEQQPGLGLGLPTEAQWEYACRAGTTTATWGGDLEIHGERNAPRLDEIAWYGGNSGVGFDLEEGWDTSDWKEMQDPSSRAGTRLVKTKMPNPWGLFDMLGNVWEWCADRWDYGEPYPGGSRRDPILLRGSERVLRGGSWDAHARYVRAAYRHAVEPGDRFGALGFRLSRGPGGRSPEQSPAGLREARDEPA